MRSQSVLKLVDLVYAAACAPDQWPRLLEALSETIGGSGGDLLFFDRETSAAQIHTGVGVVGAEFKKEYQDYIRCDPWLSRARAAGLFRAGTIGIGEDLMPARDLERTEFYNDFGKRHEYFGGLSAIISADETGGAAVSLCRRKDQRFGAAEVALMRALMPHLKRALQIHSRFVEAGVRERGLCDALNRLATGAIVVAKGGRVLFMNDSARETLAQRDGLTIDRDVLRTEHPHDTAALRALIAGAIETSRGTGQLPGGVLLLGRPSGQRALQLIISPLRARDTGMDARIHALIFITDPDRAAEPDLTLLRRVHGLSRAEADVARLLLLDKTVREIGDLLGVNVNTVRFHLKQLFSKTGTRRQSELVRVLLTTVQVKRS